MPDTNTVTHFRTGEAGVSCDGVPLSTIADQVGTPVYVYSARAIRDAYLRFDGAFAGVPHALRAVSKFKMLLVMIKK